MTSQFDELILRSMPHFVAVRYHRLLEASTPKEQVEQALQVYELGLRALAIGVVSQYLVRDSREVKDRELSTYLYNKLPVATLDTWQRVLFDTLRAYKNKRNLFFMPELYDFYWDSSTVPLEPKPDIEKPFQRLTQIHFDLEDARPSTYAQWQTLREEAMGLLRTVLDHFRFFEHYNLIRITKKEDDRYWYDRHVGLQVVSGEIPLATEQELTTGWFYLSSHNQDFLRLHPMLIFWEEVTTADTSPEPRGEIAVFEQFQQDTLMYLIAALWAPVNDERHVSDFVSYVFRTIEQLKGEKLETERLSWWQLQDFARDISSRRMSSVSGKYRSALYLQRDKTKTEFEDFLESDKVGFVLTGKSGVGKTNFMLSLAEEYRWSRPEVCILMYNSAKLDPAMTLEEMVDRDFATRWENWARRVNQDSHNIWQEIARIEGIGSKKLVLCLDAINENMHAHVLLKQIDQLVEQSSKQWTWLKIVVTSRPEAWRAIKLGTALAETLYYRAEEGDQITVEMEPFSVSTQLDRFSQDELSQAYKNYQEAYELQTAYSELSAKVKAILRDPLALRLVAETYQGREIRKDIREGEIFKAYLDRLLDRNRLRREDLDLVKEELMPLMLRDGHYRNTIRGGEIGKRRTRDNRSLHDLFHSEAILSTGEPVRRSYSNLEQADVLVMLGDPQDYEIAFKYERFYDYFGSHRLRKMVSDSATEIATRIQAYRNLILQIEEHPFLWGAVRNTLVLELAEHSDSNDLITALAQSIDQRTSELVTSAMTLRGKDEPDQVRDVCLNLLKAEVSPDAQPEASSTGRRKTPPSASHSMVRSHAAKRVAIKVAYNLKLGDILLEAACSKSSAVRALGSQHIYYLWREDKDQGFAILEQLSDRIRGRWIVPDRNAIESCLGVTLMIIFWHYKDLEKRGSYFTHLQQIWRQPIEYLLFINPNDARLSMSLKQRVREGAMRLMLRVATSVAGQAEESEAVFTLDDMRAFFPPSEEHKALFQRLLPHIDAVRGKAKSILSLQDALFQIMKDRDLLTSYLAFTVLVSHVLNQPERRQTLELVQKLFDDGIAQPPPPAIEGASPAVPMLPIMVWCVRNSIYGFRFSGGNLSRTEILPEELDLMGSLIRRFADSYRNRSSSKHGRFRNPDLGMYMYFYYKLYQTTRADLFYYLVDKAIADQDSDGLRLYVLDSAVVGSHPAWGIPRAACQMLHWMMQRLKEHSLEAELLDPILSAFAQVRVYHQEAVDDFLAELPEGDMTPAVRKAIEVRGADESLGTLLGTSAAWFARDILIDENPFMREMFAWLMQQATESRSFNEWVTLLTKQIVNVAYGQQIFQVRGAEDLVPQ